MEGLPFIKISISHLNYMPALSVLVTNKNLTDRPLFLTQPGPALANWSSFFSRPPSKDICGVLTINIVIHELDSIIRRYGNILFKY